MSGLWYAPLVAWATYAFVYWNVITYEEAYLRERFGTEYGAHCAAVPRLLPGLHGYPSGQGAFRLRDGIANEVASWIVAGVLLVLFRVL